MRSPGEQVDGLNVVRKLLDEAGVSDYIITGCKARGYLDVALLMRADRQDRICYASGGYDHWRLDQPMAWDISAEQAAVVLLADMSGVGKSER